MAGEFENTKLKITWWKMSGNDNIHSLDCIIPATGNDCNFDFDALVGKTTDIVINPSDNLAAENAALKIKLENLTDNKDDGTVPSGFDISHEAWRYRHLHPVVNQMGGWANFSHWIMKHSANYFETCKKLEAENAELKKELQKITCGYCGQLFEREWSELQEHILVCEKHPVFQAKKREAALVEIIKKQTEALENLAKKGIK